MIKFLSSEEIENAAEAFLKKYYSEKLLPIPIEEILDLKMGIHIIPTEGLFEQHNIDAFLSSDFSGLYIDQDHLKYRYSRARYSLAHEAGHLMLHQSFLSDLQPNSLQTYKEIVLGKGSWHSIMETQANMFASFLLMPQDCLEREFENEKSNSFMVRKFAKIFEVSEEAANYRLIHWRNVQRKKKSLFNIRRKKSCKPKESSLSMRP